MLQLCTAFALFGNDLAVVYGDKDSDKYITVVTAFNIGIFTLEVGSAARPPPRWRVRRRGAAGDRRRSRRGRTGI